MRSAAAFWRPAPKHEPLDLVLTARVVCSRKSTRQKKIRGLKRRFEVAAIHPFNTPSTIFTLAIRRL
ncbi:hypothetical protein IFM47457_04429 [Aspergillus lentulus]|nr:hypothetical protein IFM47457_04429 [Aspergillus lentulus]